MAVTKKTLSELEALRTRNHNTIQIELVRLGAALTHVEALRSTPPYDEPLKEISLVQDQIAAKERTIDHWNELNEELDTIKEAISQIDSETSDRRDDLEPFYEAIGVAAVEAHSDNEALSEIVEHVLLLQLDIEDRQREIQTLESNEKSESFIGKTLARGKGMVLKGSLKTKSLLHGRALREAGEKVCELPSYESFDATLIDAMGPSREFLDDIKKLAGEKSQLEQNRDEVQQKRLEIEKRERMRNPARNLRHDVDRLNSRMNDVAKELASAYVDSDERAVPADDEIESIVMEIERLGREAESAVKLSERVRAALEADRITAEIDSKRSVRARLETEIAAVDRASDQLKGEKSAQVKARGSSASLTAGVESILDQRS